MRQIVYTDAYVLMDRTDIKINWSVNRGWHAESVNNPELWVNQFNDPSIDNPQEAEYQLDMLMEGYNAD